MLRLTLIIINLPLPPFIDGDGGINGRISAKGQALIGGNQKRNQAG
jgi:hypothetical protein